MSLLWSEESLSLITIIIYFCGYGYDCAHGASFRFPFFWLNWYHNLTPFSTFLHAHGLWKDPKASGRYLSFCCFFFFFFDFLLSLVPMPLSLMQKTTNCHFQFIFLCNFPFLKPSISVTSHSVYYSPRDIIPLPLLSLLRILLNDNILLIGDLNDDVWPDGESSSPLPKLSFLLGTSIDTPTSSNGFLRAPNDDEAIKKHSR